MLKTEAIKNFLRDFTHEDLANLYNPSMEVQVNVAQEGGERVEGEYKGRLWHGWTDGVNVWKSFRIPYSAGSDAWYTDTNINFDLSRYAEGIGLTGWDWENKRSRWVAFDFDAITGHKGPARLSTTELQDVERAASQIPWVTVRKSTSGKGLHIYVFLDEITENHHEHAALARAVLGQMAAFTGFNFAANVDVCGGNMWVWHRKMAGTDGLTCIKQGEALTSIPLNWRDHIAVTTRKRNRVLPGFIKTSDDAIFEELTGQRSFVNLDETHKALINFLDESGASFWWDNDHHMLVCHTYDLKLAHEKLGFVGIFHTLATGRERGVDHNCFAFPLRRGGWTVRRYTPGVAEAPTWDQDGSGWTTCLYNVEPDLKTAARSSGGLENDKGNFIFRSGEEAENAAQLLGATLDLPKEFRYRPAVLRPHKDGHRLIAEIKREERDHYLEGWLEAKGWWQQVFTIKGPSCQISVSGNYDDTIRHLVSQGDDCGWAIKSGETWHDEPLTHAKAALDAMGLKPADVKNIIGNAVVKPWKLVNLPFKSEYPGDRCWNRQAAQLAFAPAQEAGTYETWIKILEHIGHELNPAIQENVWARTNGLKTGADYLKCYVASLFQQPHEPLPYLFLYGPQNSGKSIFHEALSLLLTSGYCRADTALTSGSNYNVELEHAILCVVEETDLKKNKQAYNRIKDWTTAPLLPIHAKYRTPYLVQNTTHWIQCSNERESCPVFAGDTRIVMIYVSSLETVIPKRDIIISLTKEAPYFLREILNLELPRSPDRLNIPVISTADKSAAEDANATLLDIFIDECCHYVPGHIVSIAEFYEKFQAWLEPADRFYWSKIKIGRAMPAKFPKGRRADAQWAFGNISFEPAAGGRRLVVVNDKLVESE